MAAHVPRAVRLTFSHAGGQLRLETATRLEMRALPSHEVSNYEQQAGFWIEVRDATDRVLYRRVLHNPLRHEVEIYPQAADEQFSRGIVADPRGSFDVVVPDLPGARSVVVFGSLPQAVAPGERRALQGEAIVSAQEAPARVIGRFAMPAAEGA